MTGIFKMDRDGKQHPAEPRIDTRLGAINKLLPGETAKEFFDRLGRQEARDAMAAPNSVTGGQDLWDIDGVGRAALERDTSGFTDVTGPQPFMGPFEEFILAPGARSDHPMHSEWLRQGRERMWLLSEPQPVRRKSATIEEQAAANVRAKRGFSPTNDEGKPEACCNAVNDRIATNPGHSLGWDCDPCNGPCIGANITDDNSTRKRIPMATGLLDMFPRALAQIAELSRYSAEKHTGGVIFLDKHHSDDDANALVRHMADRGTLDKNGFRHSCEAAWRGLAMLEHELEEAEGL